MSALEKLRDDATESRETLHEVRDASRECCVAAVRRMESVLAEVLCGESLRGMRRLCDNLDGVFVRGRPAGAEALVLAKSGRLVMVRRGTIGRDLLAEFRPADDSDFLVEDVEDLARVVAKALREHAAALGKSAQKFIRCAVLAQRIEEVLAA